MSAPEDEAAAAELTRLIEQRVTDVLESATRVAYSDEGLSWLGAAFDALTPEQLERMRQAELAMTPEDWDAFAAAMIQPGPSLAEQRPNAIEDDA